MDFEWDPAKAETNRKKHRVEFSEASSAFADTLSTTFADPDHSDEKDRFITIGMSDRGRLLIVSHTHRDDRVRLISARVANRRERKTYEEEN